MREKSGRARKREDESPSVGGGRKSAAEERRGGRRKVTRWKGGGSRRVEGGWVAASKGCRGGGTGGGAGGRRGWKRESGKTRGGQRRGPTGLENSPLFLLTLARCLIASYFRIFRVELSIETRERGFVCVLSPTALVVYSPLFIPRLFPRPLPVFLFVSLLVGFLARPCPLLLFLSFSRVRVLFLSLRCLYSLRPRLPHPPHPHQPHSPRERERERAPRAPAGRPPLGGLFKTTHSQCVRRRTGSAQGRRARCEFLL